MQDLTEQANQSVQQLAQRYGVSVDAVRTLLSAVAAGGGTMAQFFHPELGGGGQWMQGGMTMVGDMFNHGLKNLVNGLCADLSNLLASTQVFAPPPLAASERAGGNYAFQAQAFWPPELGQPSSSGGQNDSRYAYFPQTRRLAIERAGQVSVYDTLDHQIGGVQQQQSGPGASLSFSSQRGTFSVESLPLVSGAGQGQANTALRTPAAHSGDVTAPGGSGQADDEGQAAVFAALDKLGDLYHRGILSDAEFQAKKSELLARL